MDLARHLSQSSIHFLSDRMAMLYLLPSNTSITLQVNGALDIAIFIYKVLEKHPKFLSPFGFRQKRNIGINCVLFMIR
jgi:hypothetical protein